MNCSRMAAALSLAAALVLAACSSNSGDSTTTTTDAQGGGGNAGGDTTTCGTGGMGGVVEPHGDLFTCGLALDCEQIRYHNFPEPQSALTCFAHHVVSAAPGVLDVLMVPGPYDTQIEHLIVTLGDGTALTQSRFRAQTGCAWELRVHQICDVVVDPSVETACDGGDDQGCIWMPGLTTCRDVADWTCADVTAALD